MLKPSPFAQAPSMDGGTPPSTTEVIAKLYAPWLHAIADGKVIQSCAPAQKGQPTANWVSCDPLMLLLTMGEGTFSEKWLRVKPATILIGDVEVTAPLSHAPAQGTVTWCLSAEHHDGVFSFPWDGRDWQLKVLKNAALWDDRDEAVKASAAIRTLLRRGS